MEERRYKAILIDDEERAVRVLSKIIEDYCPEIEIVGTANNIPEGVLEINRNNPDVVFLDIEMPNYTGFELLEFFNDITFEIIFVTAYNRYAQQAFEVSAVDYILKPVRIDKLEDSIAKLKSKLQVATMHDRFQALKANLEKEEIQKIAIPVSRGLIFIKVNEISHIDADGSYSKLWLFDGSNILVSKKLKYFEEILAKHKSFYRIHRSHIINTAFIRKYNKHDNKVTLDNNQDVKVSRDKKGDFESFILKF